MFQDRRAAEIGASIFALVRDDPELFEDRVTPEIRAEILEQLPVILQIIAAYWRDPDRRLPPRDRFTRHGSESRRGRHGACNRGSRTALRPLLHCGLSTVSELCVHCLQVPRLHDHLFADQIDQTS
jgi:hypothetical protein